MFLLFYSETKLRLQGPKIKQGTGRVEIFYQGKWGTVCDDNWDLNDAKVVCRQLGFLGVKSALQGNKVVDGSGQIWLDNVACTGSEQLLTNCSHGGWGIHNCDHGEDAGVECLVSGKQSSVIAGFLNNKHKCLDRSGAHPYL